VNGTISIPARTIASLTRDGRRIRFTAAHPETGKPCRSDIRFELESEALAAERAIGGLMMRARADAAPRSSRRAA
jgi:hypothetical protein